MTQTNTSTTAPGNLEDRLNEALSGAETVLAKNSAIQISGKSTTQAQIITALEGYVQPFTDVATAKAAYAKAVLARKAEQAEAHEYLLTLKAGLVALFGRNSPSLAAFGMGAKVRTPPTAETIVLATAKGTLTRKLRGTLTKEQKKVTKAVGTPDVSLGLTGKSVGLGAAGAAQQAALATAAAGGASAPTVVAAPAVAASTTSTTATPAPVAPAPVASITPSAALAAVVKQS